MKKPLKIAIYSGDIPSTSFIERLILGLAKKPIEIQLFGVFSKRKAYPKNIKILGYRQNRIFKLLYLMRYRLLLQLFKGSELKRLQDFLKTESRDDLYSKVKYYPVLWHKPAIFHLQWAKGLAEWAWVEDYGMRLMLSLRGAHINYSPIADADLAAMYRAYFPKVSAFHAVSKAIGVEAEKYAADSSKIHVVYSGLAEVEDDVMRSSANQHGILNIISVGRPHWIKGYSYALDACKLLKDAQIEFNYSIVGASEAIELVYQVHDLELQDEVKLLPQQPYDVVQRLMKAADVLLLPSVEEGIANVVLEAMAVGTLVLTSNCGGMEEVIVDGENGFVVPIRDAKAIADKLGVIKLLADAERKKIARRAIETITEQHTEELMVEGMMQVYEEVLGLRIDD